MEEDFFACPVVSQVLTAAVIARSSFHIIFIFDDQRACIHLPHQYAPHLTEPAASLYSHMEVEVDHSVSNIGGAIPGWKESQSPFYIKMSFLVQSNVIV